MKNAPAWKQSSDEELARMVQAGSHHCFDELVHRYSQRLFFFLRGKIANQEEVEDLVQETFLKVYRNIHRFDQKYKFSTWIYTAATRLAISYYRKKKNTEPVTDLVSSAVDPQEQMIAQNTRKKLWDSARSLPEKFFRILWLRYAEEMSLKEIGNVMNIRSVNARVLLHRARSRLIQCFDIPVPDRKAGETVSIKDTASSLL